LFTGIITEVGKVSKLVNQASGAKLEIWASKTSHNAKIGSSIAVNGVCLTVTNITSNKLEFDLVTQTLKTTNLGLLKKGSLVNLEPSLRVGDEFGGHIITGHVETTGKIKKFIRKGNFAQLEIKAPNEIVSSTINKGSIAVDGISLTVAELDADCLKMAIIPQTLAATNLSSRHSGDEVNLESDFIFRYVKKAVVEVLRRQFPKIINSRFL
jgi:riboflavin synthase